MRTRHTLLNIELQLPAIFSTFGAPWMKKVPLSPACIVSFLCLMFMCPPPPAFADFVGDDLTREEQAWLQEHPHIRVAVDTQWAPIEFVTEEGEFRGISADYLTLLEKKLGVNFEVEKTLSWQETMETFKGGDLDLFTSVRQTPERADFILFTDSYVNFPIVIFTGPDIPYIGTMGELVGRRVAIVEGYAIHDLLLANYPDIELLPVVDVEQGLAILAKGQVDAYVGNILVTDYYLDKLGYTNIRVAGQTPYNYEQSMGVRKDWPLFCSILNKALKSIPIVEQNKTYSLWTSARYQHGPDYTLLWQVVLGALAVIAVFFYWNRRLAAEISRRKKAQTALQRERDLNRNYLATVEVMLLVLDPQGNIALINRKGCEMLGYREEELLGKNWFKTCLPLPAGIEKIRSVFKQIIAGDLTSVDYYEYTILTKGGDLRLFAWHNTMLRNPSGKISGVISSGEDITESRQAEIALREAKEAAEAANRAKQVFLANMSHELRTPLNAIIGFSSQLCADRRTPESSLQHLACINDSGNRLLSIINEAIEQSRLNDGESELQSKAVNLHSLIYQLSAKIQLLAKKKGLEFTVNYSEQVPPYIRTDPDKLHFILYNLLENGVKFTEEGHIVLRLSTPETENWDKEMPVLCIEVEDNGIGIDSTDQHRIFKPFVQLGADSLNMGTGLGLSISKGYLVLMGGDISVDSEPDKGSIFRIFLPVQKTEESDVPASLSPHDRGKEESGDSADNSMPSKELSAESLAGLPDELLTELRGATITLDIEHALKVVEQIKDKDPDLAQALGRMVHDIDFSGLQELLLESESE